MKKVFSRVVLVAAIFAVFVTLSCATTGTGSGGGSRPIGIISAMNSELQFLIDNTRVTRTDEIGGMLFYSGVLNNKDVVLVRGGIGKSLSAAYTAILIHEYNIDKLIFTGIAGGVGDDVDVLDVVIATELVTHDYGTQTNDGFVWRPGPERIESVVVDPALSDLAYNTAVSLLGASRVHKGLIATGDQFIASETYVAWLQEQFGALACEMEGVSVALIAQKFDIPTIIVRCMSDKADGYAHTEIENFGQQAADISGQIVLRLLERL